ncbi:hypothetical protein [Pelosinus sp. UFO1]|uniref:hypothetical protein n=1 Tax=Pelosinus sp. UFO1 TaxID=484770 RepID=UPI0004D17C15|nr:hypothetical protein [Pelosinus sp. UFO1]AIF51217.1 hypothetical protein UFO1_1666 [Pelosinus sp. UFO1]
MATIKDSIKRMNKMANQFRRLHEFASMAEKLSYQSKAVQADFSNPAIQWAYQTATVNNHWATISTISTAMQPAMQALSHYNRLISPIQISQLAMPSFSVDISSAMSIFHQQATMMQNALPPNFAQMLPHIQDCLYDLQPTFEIINETPIAVKKVLQQEIDNIETLEDDDIFHSDVFWEKASDEVRNYVFVLTNSISEKITQPNIESLLNVFATLASIETNESRKQILTVIVYALCQMTIAFILTGTKKE